MQSLIILYVAQLSKLFFTGPQAARVSAALDAMDVEHTWSHTYSGRTLSIGETSQTLEKALEIVGMMQIERAPEFTIRKTNLGRYVAAENDDAGHTLDVLGHHIQHLAEYLAKRG